MDSTQTPSGVHQELIEIPRVHQDQLSVLPGVRLHGLQMDSIGYILNIFMALTLLKRNGSAGSQTLSLFWKHTMHMLNHSANQPYYFGSQHGIHSTMADPRETATTATTHNPSLTTTITTINDDNNK